GRRGEAEAGGEVGGDEVEEPGHAAGGGVLEHALLAAAEETRRGLRHLVERERLDRWQPPGEREHRLGEGGELAEQRRPDALAAPREARPSRCLAMVTHRPGGRRGRGCG